MPLELMEGNEYYSFDEARQIRLNSGRSAIIYAILDGNFSKVWLPLYCCKSVVDAIKDHGIPFEFYHIDENMNPLGVTVESGDLLVWINYFGIYTSKVDDLISNYKNVLIDNTQGFFTAPREACYNVYSCRKFIGVPDGAYLIGKDLHHIDLERDLSYRTMSFLVRSMEEGTNAAYPDSLINEERIEDDGLKRMSVFTERVLKSVDYDYIKTKRRQNFSYLHQELEGMNELSIDMGEDVPMIYPLLCEKDLREYLVSKKIYIPQWWKWVIDQKPNKFEERLCKKLLPLPIDQRYSIEDMKYIANLIRDYEN